MCKVSVIMPVYNSEEYLKNAVESVLNQSFKDIELLLVDDGSTDKSGKICDEYEKKDRRVRVFHNQNQGICNTRNFGMKKAVGKYLLFIDNDDNLIPGMIEENYGLAEKNNADVVKFSCAIDESYKSGIVVKRGNYFKDTFVFAKEDSSKYYVKLEEERYFSYIWNGMYRREFLLENDLFFNPDIKCGYEDRILNYALYVKAEIQVINKNAGYQYYQRYEHSTFKRFNKNQLYACLISAKMEYDIYNRYSGKPGFSKKWGVRAAEYLIELLFTFGKSGCDMSWKEKKEYVEYLRGQEVFQVFKEKEVLSLLDAKKRSVVNLFIKKRDNSLLALCAVYMKVIFVKVVARDRLRR